MAKIDYESKNGKENGEIYHRKKYLSTVAKMDNGLANDPIVNEILQKSPFDSNAFMLVISQVKNEKNNHILFTSESAKELIGYKKHTSVYDFALQLDKTLHFIGQLELVKRTEYEDEHGKHRINIRRQHLFSSSEVDFSSDDYICDVQLSKESIPYFNNLKRKFLRFSIKEFFNLNSKYSRIIYIWLKQWRTTGEKSITPEDLMAKLKLDSQKSSKSPASLLRTKVFPIVQEELSAVFPEFRIERAKRNRKIVKYIFKWTPEDKNQDVVMPAILENSIAIANIRTNSNMSDASKYKALDRYLGWRLGTAKKMAKKETQTSFFVYDAKRKEKDSTYNRPDLNEANKIQEEFLRKLIALYERLESDYLTKEDKEDLYRLKSHLTFVETKKKDKNSVPKNNEIHMPKKKKILDVSEHVNLFNNFDTDGF